MKQFLKKYKAWGLSIISTFFISFFWLIINQTKHTDIGRVIGNVQQNKNGKNTQISQDTTTEIILLLSKPPGEFKKFPLP